VKLTGKNSFVALRVAFASLGSHRGGDVSAPNSASSVQGNWPEPVASEQEKLAAIHRNRNWILWRVTSIAVYIAVPRQHLQNKYCEAAANMPSLHTLLSLHPEMPCKLRAKQVQAQKMIGPQ